MNNHPEETKPKDSRSFTNISGHDYVLLEAADGTALIFSGRELRRAKRRGRDLEIHRREYRIEYRAEIQGIVRLLKKWVDRASHGGVQTTEGKGKRNPHG
jgi:hypothetical protein